MCSRAVSPARLTTIEQRFLRCPSLWSGKSCLVTLLEMGPLARALSTDFAGLDQRVLALFPGLVDFAGPLKRGAFLAEVLARIALQLQGVAGDAQIVHGRQTQLWIVIDGPNEQMAVQAFDQASAILLALCAGVGAASAWPLRPARGEDGLHFIHAHAGQHGQHEQQRLVAAAQ